VSPPLAADLALEVILRRDVDGDVGPLRRTLRRIRCGDGGVAGAATETRTL
jgi:hypothetical protein